MSTSDQLRILHGLTRQMGMHDTEYRDMLESAFRVRSAKDLSDDQADILIRRLRARLNDSNRRKFDELEGRPGMASPRQLRMIEAMWKDASRLRGVREREKALDELLKNRLGISMGITRVQATDVQRIRKLLEAMRDQAAKGKEVAHAQEG